VLFKAYGREAMKKSSVFEWHKWFEVSSDNMNNDEDNAHHFFQYKKGIVHFEFIPQGQTINQAYYVEPELWPIDCILHHDSAPANKVLSVKQFLAQESITEMKHPPYYPDLAPDDF
jgi:hypothetical protein